MTDLIEKIAREIRDVHAITFQVGMPEQPSAFHEAMAKAALSAIKEGHHLVPKDKPESIVKPLVWEENKTTFADKEWGANATEGGELFYSIDWTSDYAFCVMFAESEIGDSYPSIEKAKEFCQTHHVSRVLSLLNLEGE